MEPGELLGPRGEQAGDSNERVQRLSALRTDVLKKIDSPRAPLRLTRLVDHLLEVPAVTVAKATTLLGVTTPTATGDIERLEEAGFLKEWTGGTYGRIWVATPVIAIIEGGEESHE